MKLVALQSGVPEIFPSRPRGAGGGAEPKPAAMGCAASKMDAEAWLQAQPEPTSRQADAVVEESPYLELDIKQEAGAAFSWEQAAPLPAGPAVYIPVYLLNYIYMLYCV